MRGYLRDSDYIRDVVAPGDGLPVDAAIEPALLELSGDFSQPGRAGGGPDAAHPRPVRPVRRDARSRRSCSGRTRARVPLSQRTAAAVVAAWNRALGEIMAEFLADLKPAAPAAARRAPGAIRARLRSGSWSPDRRRSSGAGEPSGGGARRLSAGAPPSREVQQLARRITGVVTADTVGARVRAWARLADWTRPAQLVPGPTATPPRSRPPRASRIVVRLIESLAGNPRAGARVPGRDALRDRGLHALRRGGPAEPSGLLLGVRRSPDVAGSSRSRTRSTIWRVCCGGCFPSDAHVERFRRLPPEMFQRLVAAFLPSDGGAAWAPVRADFADGFRLLAARAKAEGLSGKLRARGLARRVSESPFYRLDLASEAVAAAWLAGGDTSAPAQEWRRWATDCWAEMGAVRRRLETDGVSVDIVYGLDVDRPVPEADGDDGRRHGAPAGARDARRRSTACCRASSSCTGRTAASFTCSARTCACSPAGSWTAPARPGSTTSPATGRNTATSGWPPPAAAP